VSKPYGVGPLKLPLWGWAVVAVVAWYLYKSYSAGAGQTTDLGYGGAAMAGPQASGGGGGSGAASRRHHHRKRKPHHHQHRGGRQHQHTHKTTLPVVGHGGIRQTNAGAGLPRHRPARSSR
jgi:hypothetical protein